jgi:hypothetical protein
VLGEVATRIQRIAPEKGLRSRMLHRRWWFLYWRVGCLVAVDLETSKTAL